MRGSPIVSADPSGSYTVLVVQIHRGADDTWQLTVEGEGERRVVPLVPAVLVLRMWRSSDGQLLRGTVRLRDGMEPAPFQANRQIEALLRAWLTPEAATETPDPDGQPA